MLTHSLTVSDNDLNDSDGDVEGDCSLPCLFCSKK